MAAVGKLDDALAPLVRVGGVSQTLAGWAVRFYGALCFIHGCLLRGTPGQQKDEQVTHG